jgi:hypothetical protein
VARGVDVTALEALDGDFGGSVGFDWFGWVDWVGWVGHACSPLCAKKFKIFKKGMLGLD